MSMEITYHIVNFVCNMWFYFIVVLLYKRKYDPRITNKAAQVAAAVIGGAGLTLIHYSGINILNAFYMIFSFELLGLVLFKVSLKKSLLYNLLLCIASVFADVLVSFMALAIWHESLAVYVLSYSHKTIGCIFVILLITLFYKVFTMIDAALNEPVLNAYEILVILCLTAFQFFVLYAITILSNDSNGTVLVITTTGFLALDIFVVHLIEQLSKSFKDKYELDSVKLQNKIQLEHYEELNRRYIETGCMLHDIEKHISAIESLSQAESFSDAGKYTSALRKDIAKLGSVFRCSNKILSAVLSQKISSAESKGIKVVTDIEDLTLDFMEETDITAVFANLLDNAAEACENADKKLISIKMHKVNDLVFISVENSFEGKLIKRGDVYKSTKENHKGLGMTSIKIAAERYGGYLRTYQNEDEKKFIADVVIPVKQLSVQDK